MDLTNEGKWICDDYKVLTAVNNSHVIFHLKGDKYRQSAISISKDAFFKMEDVSIVPGMRNVLEPQLWIESFGKFVRMVKLYLNRETMEWCNDEQFAFTPKEWNYFWTSVRPNIIKHFNE